MSISKQENIETQQQQLQHYQALFDEYNKEYRRVGLTLFKKETIDSSVQRIIYLIASLENMREELDDLFINCDDRLNNAFRLLMIKGELLVTRISTSLIMLNCMLVINLSDDSPPPSFESMQKEVGWCLDVVIFYKDSAFFLSQFKRELIPLVISDDKRKELPYFNAQCVKNTLRVPKPEERILIASLLQGIQTTSPKTMDYVSVVTKIAICLPGLQFKQDEWLQIELFFAFVTARDQILTRLKSKLVGLSENIRSLLKRLPEDDKSFLIDHFYTLGDMNMLKLVGCLLQEDNELVCIDTLCAENLVKLAHFLIPKENKLFLNDDLAIDTSRLLNNIQKDNMSVLMANAATDKFISKCDENMVKLGYYFSEFHKEFSNKEETKCQTYNQKFWELYPKLVFQWNKLNQEAKLEASQKIDYINANCYAHQMKLIMHPSLPGQTINEALTKFPDDKNQLTYIKKYFDICFGLRNEYLSKNADILLFGDIKDITNDTYNVSGYIDALDRIGTILIEDIVYLLDFLEKINNSTDIAYYDKICIEIVKYHSIISQYYLSYDLINHYLNSGNSSDRFYPEFHERYTEVLKKLKKAGFIDADSERPDQSKVENLAQKLLNKKEEEAEKHAKALLELVANQPKKTKSKNNKPQTKPINAKSEKVIIRAKSSIKAEKPKTSQEIAIDNAMELGEAYINQGNYLYGLSHIWKAFNMASAIKDVIRKLGALDWLCLIMQHHLNEQLDQLETSAQNKNARNQAMVEAEANALLAQLPRLKEKYNQQYQLVAEYRDVISSAQLEGIYFSEDDFWKFYVKTQNRLLALSKKGAKNKKDTGNLALEIEQHYDDLACEIKVSKRANMTVSNNSVLENKHLKIRIPDKIQAIFQFLAQFSGTHYLVGSLVIQLVLEHMYRPSIIAHDADFISTCSNRAMLTIAGFRKNHYMPTLYSMNRGFDYPIDLLCLQEEHNWLMHSLSTRDFRLAALSCDREGNITDFTGEGIEDLKRGRLTMIGCPYRRFYENPVLLIRTIKFMVLGFNPDTNLLDALKTYKPKPSMDNSHVLAVMRKQLKSKDAQKFLDLFCQYDLMKKMFKVEKVQDLLAMLGLSNAQGPLVQLSLFSQRAVHSNEGECSMGLANRS